MLLGISDRAGFVKKAASLAAERLLVQRMESGLAEAIVGYRDDPVVGPLVVVGAGGVLAEIYRDSVLRMAPVSEGEAEEMIEQVKGFAAIRGYRNLPRGDVARARPRGVGGFAPRARRRAGRCARPRSIRCSSRPTAWSRSMRWSRSREAA